MSSGGARVNAGRKKMADSAKLHVKTFCLPKHIIDWLNDEHGKGSHALVRELLQRELEETANG